MQKGSKQAKLKKGQVADKNSKVIHSLFPIAGDFN